MMASIFGEVHDETTLAGESLVVAGHIVRAILVIDAVARPVDYIRRRAAVVARPRGEGKGILYSKSTSDHRKTGEDGKSEAHVGRWVYVCC